MKNFIVKDKKFRKLFLISEKEKIRFFFLNRQITLNILNKQFLKFKFFKKLTHKMYVFTKFKNNCLITGRLRSVFKYVKLTRMFFKNYASFGLLSGIQKASW